MPGYVHIGAIRWLSLAYCPLIMLLPNLYPHYTFPCFVPMNRLHSINYKPCLQLSGIELIPLHAHHLQSLQLLSLILLNSMTRGSGHLPIRERPAGTHVIQLLNQPSIKHSNMHVIPLYVILNFASLTTKQFCYSYVLILHFMSSPVPLGLPLTDFPFLGRDYVLQFCLIVDH